MKTENLRVLSKRIKQKNQRRKKHLLRTKNEEKELNRYNLENNKCLTFKYIDCLKDTPLSGGLDKLERIEKEGLWYRNEKTEIIKLRATIKGVSIEVFNAGVINRFIKPDTPYLHLTLKDF